MDFKEKFKETKAATTLTKATLEKYSKTPAILPVDLHYNGDDLRLLFEKPVVLVSTFHICLFFTSSMWLPLQCGERL